MKSLLGIFFLHFLLAFFVIANVFAVFLTPATPFVIENTPAIGAHFEDFLWHFYSYYTTDYKRCKSSIPKSSIPKSSAAKTSPRSTTARTALTLAPKDSNTLSWHVPEMLTYSYQRELSEASYPSLHNNRIVIRVSVNLHFAFRHKCSNFFKSFCSVMFFSWVSISGANFVYPNNIKIRNIVCNYPHFKNVRIH